MLQVQTKQEITNKMKNERDKCSKENMDNIMTSSIGSISSSLASPGDSGVQMLDSESEIASIMSTSGFDFNNENVPSATTKLNVFSDDNNRNSAILNENINLKLFEEQLKLINDDVKMIKHNTKPDNLPITQNIDMKNIDTENIDTQDIDIENIDTQNIDIENIDFQNIDFKNIDTQNIDVQNIGAENLSNKQLTALDNEKVSNVETDLSINELFSCSTELNEKRQKLKKPNKLNVESFIIKNAEGKSKKSNSHSSSSAVNEFEMIYKELEDLTPDQFVSIDLKDFEQISNNTSYNPSTAKDKILTKDKTNKYQEEFTSPMYKAKQEDSEEFTSPIDDVFCNLAKVKENEKTSEDQIVFRRQRRKKTKDAPKKRVSFHEDILNSTKIDDVHIERGFTTKLPPGYRYLNDQNVDLGRYSWAAEGDPSYYKRENNGNSEREVKSDLYVNRYLNSSQSSTESSSRGESSSGDDSPTYGDGEISIQNGLNNIKKVPKSSCLKKTKHHNRYITTKVIDENQHKNQFTKRKLLSSESSLIDTKNLFGSLKNIYKSLSTSAPLTERGVPEGMEDLSMNSQEEDLLKKRNSYSSNETIICKSFDGVEFTNLYYEPEEVVKLRHTSRKPNLRLSRSEGFFPNYPNVNPDNLKDKNIILCDSNVYEHRGISYSYEYDQFQQNFKKPKKPASKVYQLLFNDLNIFKKLETKSICENSEFVKKPISEKWNWGSGRKKDLLNTPDSETLSDISEKPSPQHKSSQNSTPTKHLQSPLKKRNVKSSEQKKEKNWSSWVSGVKKKEINTPDSETLSDTSEKPSSQHRSSQNSTPTRHLQSPLKKRNTKYSEQKSSTETLLKIETDFEILSVSSTSEDHSRSQIKDTLAKFSKFTKESLINRFLRNVTQKKLIDAKIESSIKKYRQLNKINLYIKKVKLNREQSIQADIEINLEIVKGREMVNERNEKFARVLLEKFRNEVFRSELEVLLKIFKVTSAYNKAGDIQPLLLILTDRTLYLSAYKANKYFENHFVLPYTELNYILIGPNDQTIYVTNKDKDMHSLFTTGDSILTNDIITHIVLNMRKMVRDETNEQIDGTKLDRFVMSKMMPLPLISRLSLNEMSNLKRFIYNNTPVTKDDEFYFYSIINLQENLLSPSTTPLGPSKQGYLMYRHISNNSKWQIAYFVLRGGVLYTLNSETCRMPIHVTPLYNGGCRSAHRTPPNPRPYTFQLTTTTNSFEFAASDEYETSDWLQAIINAASWTYNNDEDMVGCKTCSLILTTDHIISMRENFQVGDNKALNKMKIISIAEISDLVAFKIPLAEKNWCVLEFGCREVYEASGDWLIYFSTNQQLKSFSNILELLWTYNNSQGDAFPICTIADTDIINRQGNETSKKLDNLWSFIQYYY